MDYKCCETFYSHCSATGLSFFSDCSTPPVFLDETGVNIDMTRRYGRAPGQERVYDHALFHAPKSMTILSSIRLDGTMVHVYFSGALTGARFLEYIRTGLVPALRKGDMVIMDNLRCHKVAGVKEEAIESAGALVCYLPPYSPDFNPIETLPEQ